LLDDGKAALRWHRRRPDVVMARVWLDELCRQLHSIQRNRCCAPAGRL